MMQAGVAALVVLSPVLGVVAAIVAGACSAVRIGGEALGVQLAAFMGMIYGALAGALGVGAGLVVLLLIGAVHG